MNTQHQPNNSPQEPKEDTRLQITKSIWGSATGMLGICVPLTLFTHSPIIPVFVVLGAAVGTIAVWMGKSAPSTGRNSLDASGAMQEKLRELEERLANVEVISSFERGLVERTAIESGRASQSRPETGRPAETRSAGSQLPSESEVAVPMPSDSSYKKEAAKEHRNRVKPIAS